MTNATVLFCLLALMAVFSLTLWGRYRSRILSDEASMLRYRIDSLQQQQKDSNTRISRLEDKASVAAPMTCVANPAGGEARGPVTLESVRGVLRENGYRPTGPDAEPNERQLLTFNIDDTKFHVDVTRLPFLILEVGYSLDPAEDDIDLLNRSAYEVTSGIFIGKAIILGEGQAVVFQAEMLCDTEAHLKDNFRRYMDIVIETRRRFYDTYQKMREEKKKVVDDIMKSAFKTNDQDNGNDK
jgi:hypothetical protein